MGAGTKVTILVTLWRWFGIRGMAIGLVVFGLMWWYGGGAARMASDGQGGDTAYVASADEEEMKSFISFVFDDAQKVWDDKRDYRKAKLVLFTGQVSSACGFASAASGPFYCPADEKVYIDLSFYAVLKDRLGAPGDFAQAYVIAHEVGHHVQNLEGNLKGGRDKGANSGSVRVELQADCYAGVWAHSTAQRDLLEKGDIAEALKAAESIGDDTLQKEASGTIRPETFGHGTSAQRQRWFEKGLKSGDPAVCDTFSASKL